MDAVGKSNAELSVETRRLLAEIERKGRVIVRLTRQLARINAKKPKD